MAYEIGSQTKEMLEEHKKRRHYPEYSYYGFCPRCSDKIEEYMDQHDNGEHEDKSIKACPLCWQEERLKDDS